MASFQSQGMATVPPNRISRNSVPRGSNRQSQSPNSASSSPRIGYQQPPSPPSASPAQSLLGKLSSSSASGTAPAPNTVPSRTPSLVPGCTERRSTSIVLQLCLTSICFGVTAWFAQATFSSAESSRTRDVLKDVFRVDIRDTLTVLAVLSGLLGLLAGVAIDTALESCQWWLTCRPGGVSMPTILATSATTGALGTLALILRHGPSYGARAWAAGK